MSSAMVIVWKSDILMHCVKADPSSMLLRTVALANFNDRIIAAERTAAIATVSNFFRD